MLYNYICRQTLLPEDTEKVVEKRIETKFKFRDGEALVSLKSAQRGNSEITIHTNVTSNELPLFLSKY